MRIGYTLPPAAAPIWFSDILHGCQGIIRGQIQIERFQSELKEFFQVRNCFLLSSGKAALTLILEALHQLSPDRYEVLIPAFTCYSVPSAVVRAGLRVRLCDVDPETLDFDFDQLRSILNENRGMLAIVSPHLFGLPADIKRIKALKVDPEVTIIEDAAQAMGGRYDSTLLGTQGDVGFFSLGRGKSFSTVEGGIVVTDSERIGSRFEKRVDQIPSQSILHEAKIIVYAMALHTLMRPSLFWLPKSLPGLRLGETIYDPCFLIQQLSAFQAGLASKWQKKIAEFQTARKLNVQFWRQALKGFPWLKIISLKNTDLEEHPLIRLPVLVQNSGKRNALLKASKKKGLGITSSYPDTIQGIKALKIEKPGESFPGAKQCARELVTFPVHSYLTFRGRQRILRCLKSMQ